MSVSPKNPRNLLTFNNSKNNLFCFSGQQWEKKLKRSANKVLAGVCGGLAEYFGMDATIVRVLYALLVLFGGVGVLLYIILALLMPAADC